MARDHSRVIRCPTCGREHLVVDHARGVGVEPGTIVGRLRYVGAVRCPASVAPVYVYERLPMPAAAVA